MKIDEKQLKHNQPTIEKLLFRPHRGTLDESMKNVIEWKNYDDLLEKINNMLLIGGKIQSISCEHECLDVRTGWDTYIISAKIDGKDCAIGHTNHKLV